MSRSLMKVSLPRDPCGLAARHMPPAEVCRAFAKSPRWFPDGLDQSWRQCGRVAIARMLQCQTMRAEIENPPVEEAGGLCGFL